MGPCPTAVAPSAARPLVELVALLPALVLVALVGWQLAVAGYSWTVASGAARAAARAGEVGAPAGPPRWRSCRGGTPAGAEV